MPLDRGVVLESATRKLQHVTEVTTFFDSPQDRKSYLTAPIRPGMLEDANFQQPVDMILNPQDVKRCIWKMHQALITRSRD